MLALRPPSRTARIVIALAVALLAVEAVTRLKLIKMSKEFQQFHSYTPRAAALAQSPGVRIPIIGSSVVHEDVDPALFAARLGSLHDIKVHAVNFTADHSYVDTWYYMLQRYFWRAGNDTDLVVISFVGRGLYDKNEIEIGRLARFFTTIEDWPEVLGTDLTTTSERVEFLLSTFWASYAARDRMQELVFGRLFPNYKTYAYQQQSLLLAHQLASPRHVRKARSLVALERLLVTAERHATRLCFVAFPTMRADWNEQSYNEARRLIEEHGMAYIDLRVTALDTAGFDDDPVHGRDRERTKKSWVVSEGFASPAALVVDADAGVLFLLSQASPGARGSLSGQVATRVFISSSAVSVTARKFGCGFRNQSGTPAISASFESSTICRPNRSWDSLSLRIQRSQFPACTSRSKRANTSTSG